MEREVFSLQEIYDSLPEYQSSILQELITLHGNEKTCEIWINSNGPEQTSRFGGNFDVRANTYWNNVKKHLNMLICEHPDYKKEYDKFIGHGRAISISTAVAISSWLSTIVGIHSVVLTPAVELFVHTTFKIGRKAYCDTVSFEA